MSESRETFPAGRLSPGSRLILGELDVRLPGGVSPLERDATSREMRGPGGTQLAAKRRSEDLENGPVDRSRPGKGDYE